MTQDKELWLPLGGVKLLVDGSQASAALATALLNARDEVARLAVHADGRVGNDLTALLHNLNSVLNTTQARAALIDAKSRAAADALANAADVLRVEWSAPSRSVGDGVGWALGDKVLTALAAYRAAVAPAPEQSGERA
jgi:hypothetical protein